MYKPKLEKNIRRPLEYGLEVFGGKWKSCDAIPPRVEYALTERGNPLCRSCRVFANRLGRTAKRAAPWSAAGSAAAIPGRGGKTGWSFKAAFPYGRS